jgi:hypothetical protein
MINDASKRRVGFRGASHARWSRLRKNWPRGAFPWNGSSRPTWTSIVAVGIGTHRRSAHCVTPSMQRIEESDCG